MKLILIHGRSQENRTESNLKKEWIDALNLGLQKSDLTFPNDVIVEFPYYGNLLAKLVNEENTRPTQIEAMRDSSSNISEATQQKYYALILKQISTEIDLTSEQKAELNLLLEPNRGKQNTKAAHLFSKFIDSIPVLRTSILNVMTKDVLMYMSNAKIKNEINTLVEKQFDTEPCVVVGHSLGSIVSYLVLKHNPKFRVKKFITIGSPLGLTGIKDFLGQLIMPECVEGVWFNAFDKRDIVSLFPLDRKYFNIRPLIENKNDVDNFTDNRHGIEGYLSDAIVAKTIYNALVS